MKLRSIFALIATDALDDARDFYVRYLGFIVAFETEWYVQLHGYRDEGDTPLEIAFMRPKNDSIPPSLQQAFDGRGVFITVELDDVDPLYERLRADGFEFVIDLRDEPWGQRHFMVRDPSGGLLDVVRPIAPTEDYQSAYVDDVATD